MIYASPNHRDLIRSTLHALADAAQTETGRPGVWLPYAIEIDPVAQGYRAGLIDLLAGLGAVSVDRSTNTMQVTSVQAGYLMRVLADLLTFDAPLIADWTSEGISETPGILRTAVDLLAVLERKRLDLLPDGPPLREIPAAVGLIGRQDTGNRRSYLVHWDAAARAWQFVGGRFEERDGSLRATLLREMSEELECPVLVEHVDVIIKEINPPLPVVRLSPTYGLLTRTTFQIYMVRFLTSLPPLHAGLSWVTEAEVLAATTADRQALATAQFNNIFTNHARELDAFWSDA